jgi:hypothetical protein
VAVRVYLDAAGYPKVGGGGLHVAHMLWGGLLLVVAALLLQLVVGRRALTLSALAAGYGVGLSIDEVGKFVTGSNDCFFAPAAPLIFGAILLLVLIWLRTRPDDTPTVPEATHGAVEAIRDLAHGRLSRPDRDRAVARLRAAGVTVGQADLPGSLLAILVAPETEGRLTSPGWLSRGAAEHWSRRLLPDRLERLLIRIGLFLSVLQALACSCSNESRANGWRRVAGTRGPGQPGRQALPAEMASTSGANAGFHVQRPTGSPSPPAGGAVTTPHRDPPSIHRHDRQEIT